MDKCQPQAKRSLRRFVGADVRADLTTRFATAEDPGRSDITFIYKRRGTYIECKDGGVIWSFKSTDPTRGWTAQQRRWAKDKISHGSDVWLWLRIGTHPANYDPRKFKPMRTYLIPAQVALSAVEQAEALGSKSIPYRAYKGMSIALRECGLNCEALFSKYALMWLGSDENAWGIPEDHPFYEGYIR